MFVVRKNLVPEQGTPYRQRYNPECDCVEISVDSGATWTQDDGADPRINPAYLLPPNTESDVKCAAAGGMVQYIRNAVDRTVASLTMVELANGLLALISVFFPIALVVEILWGIATLLLGIGTASIAAAFTEDVYEQLLCLLYCELDDDGRITQDGIDGFLAAVAAQIGDGVVDATLSALIQPVGAVGLSNAGSRLADAEADCSECLCAWCAEFDFRADGGTAWTFSITTDYGTVTASGIESGYFPPPTFAGTQAIQLGWNIPDGGFNVTRIEMDVNFPSSPNNYANFTYNGGSPVELTPSAGDSTLVFDDGFAHTVQSTGVYMQAYPLDAGDIITFKAMRWYGVGTRPAQLDDIPDCP